MELEIKQLDENLIHRANSNSFNGTRGDNLTKCSFGSNSLSSQNSTIFIIKLISLAVVSIFELLICSWWNSNKKAWSTYLNRVDKEWIESISTKYAQYL